MVKNLGYKIFEKINLLSFYSLKKSGYLAEKGWFISFKTKKAIDINGNPIPWMTYPFLDFIDNKLNKKFNIFEFGSGNSTIWWSQKIKRVIAVESNIDWFNNVKPKIPNDAEIIYREKQSYATEILKYDNYFDIISIDGIDRVNCAKNCLGALTENGVVIWDNSDRIEYSEGYDFLINNGFKRLDFHGLGPINVMAWTTSVFYRKDNCLGI